MRGAEVSSVGVLLKQWRGTRRMSQLDLAMAAGVSSRHVSFVETGRSRPSREMVLLLGHSLDLVHRDCNDLLYAAGFAPVYSRRTLDDPEMASIRAAVEFLLTQHEPYPAMAVDRNWDVLHTNNAALTVFGHFSGAGKVWQAQPLNMMRLVFDPEGLRPFIGNWEEVAGELVTRLRRENAAAGAPADGIALLSELLSYPGGPARFDVAGEGAGSMPMIALHLSRGEVDLRLFSAITTLGTAIDITAQELRLETQFPADEATAAQLRNMAG